MSATRVPPSDLEAEQAVLGAMMVQPSVIPDILRAIPRDQADRFYRSGHQGLFRAILDLWDSGRPLDLVTVRDEFARTGILESIGGLDYVVELAESVPSAANAGYHAEIVRDKATLRDLIRLSYDLQEAAYAAEEPPKEIIDRFEGHLHGVSSQRIASQAARVQDEVAAFLEELEQRRDGSIGGGLSTGFHQLDETLGGLHKGEMIVVAGRPSMGKTAFGLNIAEWVAGHGDTPVGFFSLEMTRQSVTERILCGRANVDMQTLRRGTITDQDYSALQTAAGQVNGLRLLIDDTSRLSLFDLRAKARQMVRSAGVGAIFIDYLQLMRYGGRCQSRQQEIAEISGGVKDLAKSLDVPVVVLSQLNRNPDSRGDTRPKMSDLRESGAIEQDADVVILLHRPGYYKKDDPDLQGIAEVIVDKQRNGPTGIIRLYWDGRLTRFTEMDPQSLSAADEAIRSYQAGAHEAYEPDQPLLTGNAAVPF